MKDNMVAMMQDMRVDVKYIRRKIDELYVMVDNLQDFIFEVNDNTVPRLFTILPQDGTWDFECLLNKKYCLHFLCEHEQNGQPSYHLAYHKGYPIRQTKEVHISCCYLLLLLANIFL